MPAVHKVLGTETEFGITVRNAREPNPVLASSSVINSYAGRRARIQWSPEEESPGRDARGFGPEGGMATDSDAGMVNVVLTNGARLYVDHAHPEYSSPECFDALEAARYDKAGEIIIARAAAAAQHLVGVDERIIIHKNNSDGRGNSYGAHENYLLSRQLPFTEVIKHLSSFLVTRQIFTGSGKLGSENGRPRVDYQISQRADFFEEEVGLETTLKRPIINTRDEPHGDPSKYRRLHVIIGDANLSEVQTLLKLGTTSLFLAALEEGALPQPIQLARPVEATWKVSHDLTLANPLPLADGSTATALELQWQYFEWMAKYVETQEKLPVHTQVLAEWESVLSDLESDPHRTADRLDWTAKWDILKAYHERDGLAWDVAKMRMLALQYHEMDPSRGLYHKLVSTGRMRRLFTDVEVDQAVTTPPANTRAYFRGECVARYGPALVAANWDSLVFDVGAESYKRVPMMEPLRGSREHVSQLLEDSPDAVTLLERLGGAR